MSYFEENPINKNDNIEAYSKLIEDNTKNEENKEIKTNVKNDSDPKPIIVKNIQIVENFATTSRETAIPTS